METSHQTFPRHIVILYIWQAGTYKVLIILFERWLARLNIYQNFFCVILGYWINQVFLLKFNTLRYKLTLVWRCTFYVSLQTNYNSRFKDYKLQKTPNNNSHNMKMWETYFGLKKQYLTQGPLASFFLSFDCFLCS